MKKCQLLPGAQQAGRPWYRAFQHSQPPTHTHTLSSAQQLLTGFGKRMALSRVAQLDMLQFTVEVRGPRKRTFLILAEAKRY